MIGLTGAQRVGKSTLAQRFALEADIPFVATTASGVFESLDLDPKVEYPISIRLMVQEVILKTFERQYEEAARQSRVFITDRTPVDLASYMLADISRGAMTDQTPEMAGLVNDYVGRCLASTARFFAVVVQVQPGIPLVEAPGKAPACPAYMEHLNAIQLGLLTDERNLVRRFQMPRHVLDIDERVAALRKVVSVCIESQVEVQKFQVFH
jgi:hypothetical protein